MKKKIYLQYILILNFSCNRQAYVSMIENNAFVLWFFMIYLPSLLQLATCKSNQQNDPFPDRSPAVGHHISHKINPTSL